MTITQNTPLTPQFSFDLLVNAISHVHTEMAAQASRAVNASLTLRNWVIGFYIEEYEREGLDRAVYGDRLMTSLATSLTARGVSRCDRREIYRYRQFYLSYPQIVESVNPQLPSTKFRLSGSEIVSKLSFTHIVELLQCEDATKHAFYEMECLRGNWSVRELRRQIASLYYERSGLSVNIKRLSNETQTNTEQSTSALSIRDPYVLGAAILQNLEGFLLELGHGFCFEARQNMMSEGDNPPIGILLCTKKDHALVEYPLSAIDNDIFVSKYLLELPKKEDMQRFNEAQLSDQTTS
jgi:hypothetical protein